MIRWRSVLGEEAALGDHVQPGEQSQPFIEDVAHHMAVTSRAEQFQGQQRANGVSRRNLPAAGKAGSLENAVQVGRDQGGDE
jgi:hypothetical protein